MILAVLVTWVPLVVAAAMANRLWAGAVPEPLLLCAAAGSTVRRCATTRCKRILLSILGLIALPMVPLIVAEVHLGDALMKVVWTML